MTAKLCSYLSLEMILLSRSSSLFCSGLLFVMSFTLCFFLGEQGSATSNGPEMIALMATPLFLLFLMLGWAVGVSCVDLHDLSKHSFKFLPVLHMVSW